MAIDFSQVKTITIPEGSVTKITDSNGNTLWQGVGWHTVFEGNWSKTINSNSGRPVINICDLVDCDAPLKFRITGSIDTTIPNPTGKFTWIDGSVENFNKATPPIIINKEITVSNSGIPASEFLPILISECYKYYTEDIKIIFYIQVNSDSKTLQFNIIVNKLKNNSGLKCEFTLNITKIEQYY